MLLLLSPSATLISVNVNDEHVERMLVGMYVVSTVHVKCSCVYDK